MTSEPSVLSVPFKVLDLEYLLRDYLSQEALYAIHDKRVDKLLVEWNRFVGESKFVGDLAEKVGSILDKLRLKNSDDFLKSNHVRVISPVNYYGLTVKPCDVGKAALIMVNFINDVVKMNTVRGVLTPLSVIALHGGQQFAVVSYIAIDQQDEPLVRSLYGHLEFKEGDLPPELK